MTVVSLGRSALLCALLAFGASGITPAQSAPLKGAPARIVDGWYAHNATLIMLGAVDRVVGSVITPARFPWMVCVAPSLRQARIFDSMALNAEAVLALHPDLVFVTRDSGVAPSLEAVGLDVAPVGFTDFGGMLKTIDDTASRLGTKLARDQAAAYRADFEKVLAQGASASAASRPRILHIASLDPLTVDGDRSIVDEWIRDAGGINAAQNVHGNKRPVSMEQILSWNPEIIILGADAGSVDVLNGDALWARLVAVQSHHVFRNPAGVFNWDRYSPELMLQLIWARQIIRDGHIDRGAMIGQIQSFYGKFYRHPIDKNEAARILDAQPPMAEKCR
ncbi:ABC transporter substrate-binding protein [Asaia krungthepensis]|uniref:Iron-chelating periplasmic-binding protein n=1 Tax=Asaia krungthepensis NRIC 0535 TaxID=1307925 RepID=A0ABQ0Q0G3_9PROT|nr:ABC transporter substrate-binding protein [Asaia krungthepensis]GBQ86084.1 iron-chelating periplasmic-binding protein [Asaia krungthepensis NRIC 0535]